MFAILNGRVEETEDHALIIDVGGIGFRVFVTDRTVRDFQGGEKVKLYIHESIREDAFDLYGFLTKEERNLFLQLIGVSGVGPKAALSVLSTLRPAELSAAVAQSDAKQIATAPGVGPKIAQRIALELKDKLAKGQAFNGAGESYAGTGVTIIPENKQSEAAAALAVLGYSQAEINVALKGIDVTELTLEQIIKQALKKMMK